MRKLIEKTLVMTILAISYTSAAHAAIVINEVVVNGNPDWIELKNTVASSVDISGYHLSDDTADLAKWTFPAGTTISANGYKLIYAAGSDPLDQVPGALNATFKIKQTGETIVLSNAAIAPISTVNLPDLSTYGDVGISFASPTNDGLNLAVSYKPTKSTTNLVTLLTDDIVFNEVMGKNQITLRSSIIDALDGHNGYYDWIELYNKNASVKDLTGYKINDGTGDWPIPAGTTIPGQGYLLIFASGKNQTVATANGPEIHTNFTLDVLGGKELRLKRANNGLIDLAYVGGMNADNTFGRLPNGTGNYVDLMVPSPKANNVTAAININSVTVNEVAANETVDWVELYNSSAVPINLAGSFLTDDETIPHKWQFPPQTIVPANGYYVVYASNLNKVVYDGGDQIIEVHTNFAIKNDGTESIRLTSSDDSYYNRIDKSVVGGFLTGQSISRIPDGSATLIKVAVTKLTPNVNFTIPPDAHSSDIVINEINPDNDTNVNLNLTTYPDGNLKDYIELYNKGSFTVNVQGMVLQTENEVWTFPSQTIAPGGYLLVFASGLSTNTPHLHTNFIFNHSVPFNLKLINTNGVILNEVNVPTLGHDQSYARIANGTGAFIMDTVPSPAATNINSPVTADAFAAANLIINEALSNNVNNIGLDLVGHPTVSKHDWIEIYNKSASVINLYQLKLTDTKSTWVFPPNTTINPGQYLLVYATGADYNNVDPTILSANFSISSSAGETVQLLNRDNSIIDTVEVPISGADVSCARFPNVTGSFQAAVLPTSMAVNSVAIPVANASNIVINEVISNNVNNLSLIAPPATTQLQDWIELYNKGAQAVNLQGLKLSDSTTSWVMPSKVLNPGEFWIVYASSRDIKVGNEWHTNFNISASNGETIKLLNTDNSVIDTSVVPPLNSDQSWSRLPNGTGNPVIVSVPTALALNNASAVTPNPDAVNITINEVVTDNSNNIGLNLTTYPGGNVEDWIELYNKGAVSVDLAGLKLQDKNLNTWAFPTRILNPGQYLLVFASGRDLKGNELHTNFSLNNGGDTLKILNRDNSLVATLSIPALGMDQGYARIPDGTGAQFATVSTPTPGAFNSNSPVAPNPDASNITINEIVSDNVNNVGLNLTTYPGGAGHDWIELYNKGAVAVNVQGLKLSNKETTWVLPARTLNPGSYLLVFASGNNTVSGNEWHANFTISRTQGDMIKLLNKNNAVIQTVVVGALNANEAYARLPNGTGLMTVVTTPSPEATNINAPVGTTSFASDITINEVMSDNANNVGLNLVTYPSGNREDWIELYNKGTNPVNLQGLKLADTDNTTWVFPSRVLNPGEYLLVFASGNDLLGAELHTNFKISSSQVVIGGGLKFLNKNNAVIQTVDVPALDTDQAYARLANGTGTFKVTTGATPAAFNSNVPVAENPAFNNIIINEFMPNNVNNINLSQITYPGTGGHGWIELYNNNNVSVNLQGLKLVQQSAAFEGIATNWIFPSKVMPANSYLVVSTSGLDIRTGNQLHTNFTMASNNSQEIIATANKGTGNFTYLGMLIPGTTSQDVSNAILPNITGSMTKAGLPTPGTPNGIAPAPPAPTTPAVPVTPTASESTDGDGNVTLCYRCKLLNVPSYLVPRYIARGASVGACLATTVCS